MSGGARVWLLVAGVVLCACATGRAQVRAPRAASPLHSRGVYHPVKRGQTLWRIARTYGVSVQELVAANQLANATEIEAGTKLWIPRASRVLDVPITADAGEPKAAPHAPPPPATKVAKAEGKKVAKVEEHVAAAPPGPTSAAPAEDDEADGTPSSGHEVPPPAAPAPGQEHFIWPVHGFVESAFGPRGSRRHDGIDIKADKGTPIVAAESGEVLYAGVQRGYGNIVLVKHGNDLITIYAHNDENRVKQGDHVKQGQTIAVVGQTGRATNNHLHFEVRKNRVPQNPLAFLPVK